MDKKLKDKIDKGIKKFMSDDRHFEKKEIELVDIPEMSADEEDYELEKIKNEEIND